MDPREFSAEGARQKGYYVAGEPGMVFTRFDLRNRIRGLEIVPETEIAPEGSDDYRPASDYPELSAYFSLVSRQRTGASPLIRSSLPPEPVVKRLIPAILYPFKGMGSIAILAAAALQVIPFVGLLAAAVVGVYGLAIARSSSKGLQEMPPPSEMGRIGEIVVSALKLFVLSFVGSLVPILAIFFAPLPFSSKPLLLLAILVLYLPSSMAILARWNRLSAALSPSQVFSLIGTLGVDYFAALASILVIFVAIVGAAFLPATLAQVVIALISVWAGFYMMHLIGWAMWRHESELPSLG